MSRNQFKIHGGWGLGKNKKPSDHIILNKIVDNLPLCTIYNFHNSIFLVIVLIKFSNGQIHYNF